MEFVMKLYPLVPLCLMVVTAILAARRRKKLSSCKQCTGTIVRFCKKKATHVSNTYGREVLSPVIAYTVDGETHEFIGGYYSTFMKVGKTYTVLYDEEDCSKASLKGGMLAAAMITGAAALVSFIPIVVYAILKSKGILSI